MHVRFLHQPFSSIKIKTGARAEREKSCLKLPRYQISLPLLAEQHEIVRRVGMLFERADAIDREVVAAGQRRERLTLTVLEKAFAAKL